MSFKEIKKTEKRITYTGTGSNIEIPIGFSPVAIQGLTPDGNKFLYIVSADKTWYFSDGAFTSIVNKYEITSGGISIDTTNHKVIVGDNSYINTSGDEYIMFIFGEGDY